MEVVTLSSKGQIVIPSRIRKEWKLKSGEKLMVECEHNRIILRKAPERMSEYGSGLHADIWEKVDVEEYVKKERESWENR